MGTTVTWGSHHGHDKHSPLVRLGHRRRGAVHRRCRRVHRQRSDPVNSCRSARKRCRDRSDHRGLPDHLRGTGDHRRPARRYLRPQAHLPYGCHRLHHGFAVVWLGTRRPDADFRTRRPGCRRGDDGAAGPRQHSHAVPRRRASGCVRDLRRRHRARRRGWVHRRGLARGTQSCRHGVAQHLRRQRANRHRHRRGCIVGNAGNAW